MPEIGYYITTNYWCFVRDNRSDTFGLLKYLRSNDALLSIAILNHL